MCRFNLRILILFGLLVGYLLVVLVYCLMNADLTINLQNTATSISKTLKLQNTATPIGDTNSSDKQSTGMLCFFYNGRLGNLLFQHAALIGIARQKNMVAAIRNGEIFPQFFHFNAIHITEKKCTYSTGHWCKRPCAYDLESVDFDSRQDTHLMGSFQSWRYFIDVEKELREQFKFQELVLDRARRVLLSAVASQTTAMSPDHILVGIHVRRSDMMQEGYVKGGYKVAPKEYFLHAMDFFRTKFHKILFVVCTLDVEWSKHAIPHADVVFIPPQQAEVDLAVLSLCDHMIMSVGTFGWWAGWLAGGITVYYKHQYREGSELAQHFDMDDYMYPGWIGLD